MVTPRREKSSQILSVQKAVALLRLFSEQQPELSLAKMAEQLGLPKTTVYGLVKTLEECQFLQRDRGSVNYRLGVLALKLGYLARLNNDLAQRALPFLENLLDETQQIVYLAVPHDGLVLYIEALYPPRRRIRYSVVGRTTYMHATALGKAMLSQMSPSEIEAIIQQHGLPAFTNRTITDKEALLEEIKISRERGYAVDMRESDPMIACVAVPFRTISGELGGAISISGPYQLFTPAMIDDYVQKLVHACSILSRQIETPLFHSGRARDVEYRVGI